MTEELEKETRPEVLEDGGEPEASEQPTSHLSIGETYTNTNEPYIINISKAVDASGSKTITLAPNAVQVKSVTDDAVVLGGYAVIWGSDVDRDLEGEYFTKETDFWLDKWDGARPVLYEHGQHPRVKHTPLGQTIKMEPDELGLNIEAELSRHNEYIEAVLSLAAQGALGWSSGAVSHLVERTGGRIKSWPIAEMTLTVQPAEPRLLGADVVGKLFDAAGMDVPGAFVKVGEQESGDNGNENVEVETMSELTEEGIAEIFAAQIKAHDEAKEAEAAEQAELDEKLEIARTEGFEAGKAEGEAKAKEWAGKGPVFMQTAELGSEGDPDEGPMKAFWYYVRTGDKGALRAMQEGTDCEGGYLVPQGFSNEIAAKLAEASWPRVAGVSVYQHRGDQLRIPVEGTEPALPTISAEEASYVTDSPTIEVLDVTLYKYTKLIKVSEELLEDTPLLMGWLPGRVAEAYAEAEGKFVAVGTGSSQPSGVTVSGTAGLTFDSSGNITADEIPELFYKLQSQYRGRPTTGWAMHPELEAYIRMIRDANNFAFPGGDERGGTIARGNWQLSGLYSKPVYTDDDFATIAASAKVIVIGDWSYYALVEHPSGFSFKRLEELYAANGQIGLRWYKREGGGVLQAEAFQYGSMSA